QQWGVLAMLVSVLLPCCLSQQTTPSPQQSSKLKFRLAGYPRKHNEGRIEVFYKGEWGTICDDDFSLENAQVLCKQLGFISATGWAHSAKYGKGTGKIWLDNVQCSGSENSIGDCKSRGWGNSDCTHDEDAGVVCKDERLPGFVESNVIEVGPVRMPQGKRERDNTPKDALRLLAPQKDHSSSCQEAGLHLLPYCLKTNSMLVLDQPPKEPVQRKPLVGSKDGKSAEEFLPFGHWVLSPCWPGAGALRHWNEAGLFRDALRWPDVRHFSVKHHYESAFCCTGRSTGINLLIKDNCNPNYNYEEFHKNPLFYTQQVEENRVEEVRLRPVVSYARKRMPITEGIVEVKHKDGWAQICDVGWTSRNSRVICGMMGFPHERKANKNFYKKSDDCKLSSPRLYAERQQNHYLVHSVACTGHEVHLSVCPLQFNEGNATASCEGGMPAVVSCAPGPQYAVGSSQKKKQKTTYRVRLKGGAKTGEGRVEVLKNNEWGTVCDDRWSLQAASVVCRELGFGSAKEALTGARMGQGMGPIHMNEVQCSGHEKSIWDCQFKNITAEDCQHQEDASVKCNVPYMAYETTIRLSGGRTRYEGRVEVVTVDGNGTESWGLVCGEGWGTREAMVACRQLGLGFANHGLQETWYWDSSNVTEMVTSGVRCTGDEMALSHCQAHAAFQCQKASPRFAAGVICSETASDLILNAPLVQQTVYIEDRPLHMLYCAAEEDCLAKSAAKANWPYGHRRLLRFSSQIHNIGRADFRPKAGRHSWVWHECHRHYHSMDIFTHYDLLSVNGSKVADGHKASFCLEDTECQEGVSKRYECANFGEQGITVGCWDLYRHDIDCQWIDMTDVKPGNYILQVVINPNYEVAESDFTNNAMKCNCKYDGHRIWLHNCHIGDAFSEEAERRFEQYPGQLNNQIS
uniref:Lysyl oxidase homolog n=1 Tax=Lepisosteus oculatus TaxID=7918 RepID=W5M274_LEPOC